MSYCFNVWQATDSEFTVSWAGFPQLSLQCRKSGLPHSSFPSMFVTWEHEQEQQPNTCLRSYHKGDGEQMELCKRLRFTHRKARISQPIHQLESVIVNTVWEKMASRVVRVWEAASEKSKTQRKTVSTSTSQTCQVKNHRSCSTPACSRDYCTTPVVHGIWQCCKASSKPGESLPDTSCCPGNPTGTMPKLFIAVAQAVGSVTDMLRWAVSRAILPKPSAAVGETNSA